MRINDTSFACAGFISFSTPPAFSSDTVPMRLTVLTGSKCSKNTDAIQKNNIRKVFTVMETVYQVICLVFIAAAAVFFLFRNKKSETGASTLQVIMAVFQLVLCGGFFALCISDVFDIRVNFSYERLVLDFFYAAAFLAISIYTLATKHKEDSRYFKGIIWTFIALIAVQCFVFPYGTENIFLRIFESLEGAVVFGLLIALLFNLEKERFSQNCLLAAVALELIVAVENTIIPFAAVTEDFQLIDIPLNYASLFMRPVLFASLALSYRVWLNMRGKAIGIRKIGKKAKAD